MSLKGGEGDKITPSWKIPGLTLPEEVQARESCIWNPLKLEEFPEATDNLFSHQGLSALHIITGIFLGGEIHSIAAPSALYPSHQRGPDFEEGVKKKKSSRIQNILLWIKGSGIKWAILS